MRDVVRRTGDPIERASRIPVPASARVLPRETIRAPDAPDAAEAPDAPCRVRPLLGPDRAVGLTLRPRGEPVRA